MNVLYLNTDNTLADCMEVENTNLKENDVVQDYKKLAKKKQVENLCFNFLPASGYFITVADPEGVQGVRLNPTPHFKISYENEII